MVVGGHRDTACRVILSPSAKIQNWGIADDLWQTVQPGPGNEQQA